MRKSLLVRQVLPSLFWYALLIAAALGVDSLLHRVGLYWIGRYLGILGTVVLLASFAYSLRKRQILQRGSPKTLLQWHEALSWIGVLMILVHAGVHFNAVLPWAAVAVMLIAVASGFTGKNLLKEARERLKAREADLKKAGLTDQELSDKLLLDSLTIDLMKKWRAVHLPITAVFTALAVLHILSILIFWRW